MLRREREALQRLRFARWRYAEYCVGEQALQTGRELEYSVLSSAEYDCLNSKIVQQLSWESHTSYQTTLRELAEKTWKSSITATDSHFTRKTESVIENRRRCSASQLQLGNQRSGPGILDGPGNARPRTVIAIIDCASFMKSANATFRPTIVRTSRALCLRS